jgi:aspartate carbamoyltransferase regulatory subunit
LIKIGEWKGEWKMSEMNEKDDRIIGLIESGIVIDHMAPGQTPNVLKILGIVAGTDKKVSIGMNVSSPTRGKKDILKIEGKTLAISEIEKIAVICPNATINIINDFRVIKKERVKVPDEFVGILKCQNPSCISNDEKEPVKSKFHTRFNGKKNEGTEQKDCYFQCHYCGEIIEQPNAVNAII